MSINFQELATINDHLGAYPRANLLLVTKNRNQETIKRLIELGYQNFGENKVQEAKEKFSSIRDVNVKLHLIGPLQTNKVKMSLQLFDTIQTIDRKKLVIEISKQIYNQNFKTKTKYFFIQVNIGSENQKSGVMPEDLKDLYDFSIMKKLNISGLMCIPPVDQNPKDYFLEMRNLRDQLNKSLKLSMGMSGDYQMALTCGSDLVRIGSRIFE